MDATQPSFQLLEHFDGTADAAQYSDEAVAAVPIRGVTWVLKWAAALMVLAYSTTVLAEFAYCVATEQILSRAARAGVLEATLPRATLRTVEQAVWRRLKHHAGSPDDVKLALLQNGALVGKKFTPHGGARLALTLSMPARAMMPDWLCALTSWRAGPRITTRAERTMPGRQLTSRTP